MIRRVGSKLSYFHGQSRSIDFPVLTFYAESRIKRLVDISLVAGKSGEHMRAISNGVHEAWVETFESDAISRVPPRGEMLKP